MGVKTPPFPSRRLDGHEKDVGKPKPKRMGYKSGLVESDSSEKADSCDNPTT